MMHREAGANVIGVSRIVGVAKVNLSLLNHRSVGITKVNLSLLDHRTGRGLETLGRKKLL